MCVVLAGVDVRGGKVAGIVGELGQLCGHVGNLCLCVGMGGRRERGRLILDKSIGSGIGTAPIRLHIDLCAGGNAVKLI